MIKCCMFDLDGTLLDTLDTITYYVNRSLEREGLPPSDREECRLAVGNGARELIERIYEGRRQLSKEETERILGDYKRDYNRDSLYLTVPYEGVPELISRLSLDGYTLAVLSNKQDGAVQSLVRHFFGDAFKIIRGGRDGVALKPAPEAPLALCRELSLDPSEIAFIGDTAVDIETGKNMGAGLTVGVSWGFRSGAELEEAGADTVVDRALEMLRVFGKSSFAYEDEPERKKHIRQSKYIIF